MKKLCLALFVTMLLSFLQAEIRVMSSVNRNSLSLDDQLQYTIKISSDSALRPKEPTAPSIEGFSFRNMYSSSSQQTTFINFQRRVEISVEYVYIYLPTRLGRFTIAAQTVVLDGKSYRTSEHVVNVVSGSSTRNPRAYSPRTPFGWDEPDVTPDFGRSLDDVFLQSIPASSTVYKGEPVIVSYYVYSGSPLGSFQLDNEEDFPGYGKSTFFQPDKLDLERVQHNGRSYHRALIKRLVLSPHNTGSIKVPVLSGSARLYSLGYQSRTLRSGNSQITVLPLPEAERPLDFSGAVGRFRVSENPGAKQVSLGEAITYSLIIEGRGNFNQFLVPSPSGNTRFRISKPQVADNLTAGVDGRRTVLYTILPQEAGTFNLPVIRFSWFDSESGSYKIFESRSQEVLVKPSSVLSQFTDFLGGDKGTKMNDLLPKSRYRSYRWFTSGVWFWLAVITILALVLASAYDAWRKALRTKNPARYAKIQAEQALTKHFLHAREAAQRLSTEFYSHAETGITSFLAERYKLSNRLSSKEKMDMLAELGLSEETLEKLETFLTHCREAKYMPVEADAALENQPLATLNRGLNQRFL
ncbi:MAG: BatD family protein, partial [Candidatus Cloacimonadota bacterium]